MNLRLLLAAGLAAASLSVAGCASNSINVTTGSQYHEANARAAEDRARQAQRAGVNEAANLQQDIADHERREARKGSGSALEWLVDVLFYSWLSSGTR